MLGINARFLNQPVTGVQRYGHEIIHHMIQQIEFILFHPRKIIVSNRATEKTITTKSHLNGHLWEQLIIPLDAQKYNVDVLFSPCNTGPLAISNQVVTIHDASVFDRPEGYSSNFVRWYKYLLPRLASRVATIITVSQFSKYQLSGHLKVSPDKIQVIYCGVNDHFQPCQQSSLLEYKKQKNLPEKYVFALGSRAKNKNFLSLLKAWKILNDNAELNDTWLVIAGGISKSLQSDELSVMVNSLPRVIDLGYVTDEELPSLYSGAQLFVFPSLYEGFGLPPLEAMACGTPVVVSNTASLPEVVGDAGIYINPNDVVDIARGILSVLNSSSDRKKLSAQGIRRAKHFTWKETAEKTINVLQSVRS